MAGEEFIVVIWELFGTSLPPLIEVVFCETPEVDVGFVEQCVSTCDKSLLFTLGLFGVKKFLLRFLDPCLIGLAVWLAANNYLTAAVLDWNMGEEDFIYSLLLINKFYF